MTTWFTSDTHYLHSRIIEYANRPFKTAVEMHDAMINRWNAVVSPDDHVYHLGDFAFCSPPLAEHILHRLNGHKYMIWGNHDYKRFRDSSSFQHHFIWCKDLAEIKINNQSIVLCHYAMRVWNKSHHGSWHLFGHSHGTITDDPGSLSIDVGVDCWNYTPVSFEQVAERMSKKVFTPIDGHGRR